MNNDDLFRWIREFMRQNERAIKEAQRILAQPHMKAAAAEAAKYARIYSDIVAPAQQDWLESIVPDLTALTAPMRELAEQHQGALEQTAASMRAAFIAHPIADIRRGGVQAYAKSLSADLEASRRIFSEIPGWGFEDLTNRFDELQQTEGLSSEEAFERFVGPDPGVDADRSLSRRAWFRRAWRFTKAVACVAAADTVSDWTTDFVKSLYEDQEETFEATCTPRATSLLVEEPLLYRVEGPTEVRHQPREDARILGRLTDGDEVQLFGECGPFVEVSYRKANNDLETGWILKKHIALLP